MRSKFLDYNATFSNKILYAKFKLFTKYRKSVFAEKFRLRSRFKSKFKKLAKRDIVFKRFYFKLSEDMRVMLLRNFIDFVITSNSS